MPTELAHRYLAQLDRVPALPTDEVQGLIRAAGIEVAPAWTDFHERYAGYLEPVAGELARWGLAFPDAGSWFDAREISLSPARGVLKASLMCADVHPSHDYLLYADGRFVGPPFSSVSFDVKVERNAVLWDFARDGSARRVYELDGVRVRNLEDALLEELGDCLVPEASDAMARYYRGPDKLLAQSVKHGGIKLMIR